MVYEWVNKSQMFSNSFIKTNEYRFYCQEILKSGDKIGFILKYYEFAVKNVTNILKYGTKR